jgi:IS5 family transposase
MSMKRQQTLGDMEYNSKKRKTRKEVFLERMEALLPWKLLISTIEPVYYKTGPKGGRPAIGIEMMLRMLLISAWFNLSDEATEDAVTENQTIRHFVGVDLSRQSAPDATTLQQFRALLLAHGIFEKLFAAINKRLEAEGMMISTGTIVDATIIEAPTSTKNEKKERDPEMHSTKKGNQWHFGMKAHIGVDEETGIVHTVTTTAANVADVAEAHELLRDKDSVLRGDAGYIGVEKRPEIIALGRPERIYEINMRRGKLRHLPEDDPARLFERANSSIRAKVERPFLFVKRIFGYCKVRYRGLAKNRARLLLLFATTNLLLAREYRAACYAT